MGAVVSFPTNQVESDTVRALEDLLVEARAGKVVGISYVALRQRSEFSVGVAGEARRRPTLTRGMLLVLDGELSALMK